MKHHILLPIDFSPVSEHQIAYVSNLISDPKTTKVSLYHVIPIPAPVYFDDIPVHYVQPPVEPFRERLKGLAKRLRSSAPGLEVVPQVVSGSPNMCLRMLMKNGDYDEIVIGSHGHGALFDLLFGSVAAAVLKHASCPVYVLPSNVAECSDPATGPVLACIDLTETTTQVLETAASVAQRLGREVVALYAEPGSKAFHITGYSDLDAWAEKRLRILERTLEKRCRAATAMTAIPCEAVVRIGPPVATLRNEIEDINPALVVVGAHRKGVVHDLIIGSVSRTLLKHASVPVLVADIQPVEMVDQPSTKPIEDNVILPTAY